MKGPIGVTETVNGRRRTDLGFLSLSWDATKKLKVGASMLIAMFSILYCLLSFTKFLTLDWPMLNCGGHVAENCQRCPAV